MTITSRRRFTLDRTRTLGFLYDLEATPHHQARTVYLPPGTAATEIEQAYATATGTATTPELCKLTTSSATGTVLLWNGEAGHIIVPPFPLAETEVRGGLITQPLRDLLTRKVTVLLVLVRLGAYAVGLAEDEVITKSKTGTGLIHGRHRKGGSSQQRFQRHREKQTEQFLIRVCQRVADLLLEPAPTPDYLIYGGAWTTILTLEKRCPELPKLGLPLLPPLLDITQPKRIVLEAAVKRVWSSRITELVITS